MARVLWSGPKSFTVSGRYQHGSFVDLGLTALIQIGAIRISVVSHFAFAVDGDPFFIFGEKPEDYETLPVLHNAPVHFQLRAALPALAAERAQSMASRSSGSVDGSIWTTWRPGRTPSK